MNQKCGMQENDTSELTPPAAPRGEPRRSSVAVLWNALSWVRDLAFSVLIAVVSIVFIYQPVKVEGTSMTPGLDDQERIFINKFTYRFGLGNIERGDTVVFRAPVDDKKSYIKRIIGLPGDRVRIERGQVYVNGRALVEHYIQDDYRDYSSMEEKVAPPGKYFVLGDPPSARTATRAWGWVPRENIYGKAVFAYWPLARMGRLK